MRLKIFFDLDGTLIDPSKRHHFVYKSIIKSMGGKPLKKSEYWSHQRSKTAIVQIIQKSSLSKEVSRFFSNEFKSKIEDEKLLEKDVVFKYTKQVLEELKSRADLFLISYRQDERATVKQLQNLGILHYFKKIKIGQFTKKGYVTKIEFMKQLGVTPNSIIVGDTEDDIQAGKHLKVTSVAVLSGIRNRRKLKKFSPDFLIPNVSKLPNLLYAFHRFHPTS